MHYIYIYILNSVLLPVRR